MKKLRVTLNYPHRENYLKYKKEEKEVKVNQQNNNQDHQEQVYNFQLVD